MSLPAGTRVFVSGAALVEELCDDTRFDKQVGAGLRPAAGSTSVGLFTSDTTDPLRRRPHNILMALAGRAFEQSADLRVYTAFSREPRNGCRYAQHELLAHRDEVWDLLERGATVFVCGNARTLAPGVRAALTEIAAGKKACSADEAQSWLADLRADRRYLEDIWGVN